MSTTFVVGWLIDAQESAALAQQLVAESYTRQGLARDQLSIHSDRGGPTPSTCSAGASVTPAAVHPSQAPALFLARQHVLAAVCATHPERFVRGVPQPPAMPTEVWINRPEPAEKVGCDTAELQ